MIKFNQDPKDGFSMRKRILVVDDDEELCEAMSLGLSDYGYDTGYATSGLEGLEAITTFRPNLLILDIRMPGMDGLETMKEIIWKHPNLVTIVLTGHFDPTIARKAIEYGVCEFLTKPVTLEKLVEQHIHPLLKS